MALPPGITPKTVTIGIASFFDGSIAGGRVTISAPVNVIHTPTNRPLFSSDMTQSFVDGAATFNLCPTDATGLNRVDWSYKLKVEISGASVQPDPIYFTLPTAGPDTVDLDGLVTVPSSAGIPISVDVLTAEDLVAYAPTSREFFLDTFGADPTGAADSSPALTAAVAAMPTVTVHADPRDNSGASITLPIGTLRLGAGTYRLTADSPNLGPFVSVIGAGSTATAIDYRGSGSALRGYNPLRPANSTFDTLAGLAGRIDGLTVLGNSAQAGAIGVRYGDLEGLKLGPDLTIRGFNKAGAVGLLLENQYSWTENVWARVDLADNTTNVELRAGQGAVTQGGFVGGDNSFMYNDLTFKIYGYIGQDGVALTNGATYQGGSLKIRANMAKTSGSPSNALLRLTGQTPNGHLGGGNYSKLYACHLEVQAEVGGGNGNTGPYTIYMGDVGQNSVTDSSGVLSFQGSGWQNSNWTLGAGGSWAVGSFGFAGVIIGDSNLGQQYSGFQLSTSLYYAGSVLFADGGFPTHTGDFVECQLTQNMNVNFQRVGTGRQKKILRITQAASSGPYTVTWPSSVKWPGGTAPVVTQTAGAVDLYEIYSYDGAIWYGVAHQNMR